MKKYILDGYEFTTRADSYKYMKSELDFPSYFGENLDALWDVLTEFRDVCIVINNARQIPKQLGGYGLKILDIFGDLNGDSGVNVKMYW